MTLLSEWTCSTPEGEVVCYQAGQGQPTVLLLSGMGVPAHSWFTAENDEFLADLLAEPVFLGAALAQQYRVMAYNRAGIGQSTVPPGSRTLADGLQELQQVLGTPSGSAVVLIGHSIGGLLAFEYAKRHPERIRALVLLDSSHPHQLERLKAVRSSEHQAVVEAQQVRIREEHPERWDFQRVFSAGHSVQGQLMNLPLLVISRGVHFTAEQLQDIDGVPVTADAAQRLADEWNAMQLDLAASSTQGKRLVAARSGHYPHFDEPTFVLHAVSEFIWGLS